ncbi:MAG: regulatory signaling modulator protein AmpE [Gammaproteobacteria bacterium]
MNFFIIIVALLLDQMFRPFEPLRVRRWYEEALARWAGDAGAAGEYAELLAPFVPSFILAFAFGALGWGFASANPILGFVYGVIVLVFCFGPRKLTAQASAYLKARAANDQQSAQSVARLILGHEPPPDPRECGWVLAQAVLVRADEWIFSAVFWFALLGPLGAVLFRVAAVVAERAATDRPLTLYARSALRLKLVMAWVPQHLLALTYTLAGGFDGTLSGIRQTYAQTTDPLLDRGNVVLGRAGSAALLGVAGKDADEAELLHAAVDLVWRSIVIWLAVIGIIELLAWVL